MCPPALSCIACCLPVRGRQPDFGCAVRETQSSIIYYRGDLNYLTLGSTNSVQAPQHAAPGVQSPYSDADFVECGQTRLVAFAIKWNRAKFWGLSFFASKVTR
jgi:hypothetical protein